MNAVVNSSSKKSIKVVCFDADGVVVNPQMQFSRHLKEEYGISPAETRSFFNGVFNDCLVGKADLKQILPPFLSDWGWHGSVDEFIQTWLYYDHVIDDRLVRAIQGLRQDGLLCCLATSQEANRARYMKTQMGFQGFFDHLFFSCEMGWQKPDHAYFQHIQDSLDIGVEAVLFWDDNQSNISAAREFGWNAELYTGFLEFEQTMNEYCNRRDKE